MKLLILTLALLVATNCSHKNVSQTNKNQSAQNRTTPNASTPPNEVAAVPRETEKSVPAEFKGIDFENFSYRVSGRRMPIRLEHGKYEFENDKTFGHFTLELEDVNYADLTVDGEKEAVVELSMLSCGASCDGGAALFYFYSVAGGKPRLVTRLETGSIAYDCGLKSFVLRKSTLTLETFRSCRFNGVGFDSVFHDSEEKSWKGVANRFTRFVLEFNGRGFHQTKRAVYPFPAEDIRNYEASMEISDD